MQLLFQLDVLGIIAQLKVGVRINRILNEYEAVGGQEGAIPSIGQSIGAEEPVIERIQKEPTWAPQGRERRHKHLEIDSNLNIMISC
jgi:hypothetical protein